jgi:hypothetical protein
MLWIAALVIALIPALAYGNFILNHFYLQGAYFWDSGAVASVIWRRDMWLTYALLFPLGSLYAYHVMPLLSLLTLVSRWLPIGMPEWFALVIGVGHALPAIGVFWLLTEGLGLRSGRGLAISVILAVGFAFSGIPLATILFPHPEIILAGGLILLCAAIALERYWIALGFLVLALSVREDAGFHAFAIMFLLAAVNHYRRRPWREQRWLIFLATIGFGYSVAAVLFKQIGFPTGWPLFVSDYLGDPPFSGTSFRQVLLNLALLPIYRAYVFWPAAAALYWAGRSRDILIALGYVAFVPWLLLHMAANRDIPAAISGYYAFPFLVASAWPLASFVIDARQRGVRPNTRHALAGFTVMLALSFLGLSTQWNPGRIDPWKNFTTLPSLEQQRATTGAVELLLTSSAAMPFGTIFIDQSIYSLAPYAFDATAVVGAVASTLTPRSDPPGTLVYFESGIDIERIRAIIASRHLTRAYRFKDTSIRLASDRNLDAVPGLEPAPPEIPPAQ